jgi:hypothetical protein
VVRGAGIELCFFSSSCSVVFSVLSLRPDDVFPITLDHKQDKQNKQAPRSQEGLYSCALGIKSELP